jgi:hypothetical protein
MELCEANDALMHNTRLCEHILREEGFSDFNEFVSDTKHFKIFLQYFHFQLKKDLGRS